MSSLFRAKAWLIQWESYCNYNPPKSDIATSYETELFIAETEERAMEMWRQCDGVHRQKMVSMTRVEAGTVHVCELLL